MTDESTLHSPPEALDALEEIVTKNRPSAIGALIYTTLCRVFDKQDDKRREYLKELAEFFRLLATDENAHLRHEKSRPIVLLNPSKPPEL